MAGIKKIVARQILDSRDDPTVECEITLDDGSFGRAAVPSGASTGSREALELRDKDSEYLGRGVMTAVSNVQTIIAPKLVGFAGNQKELDDALIALDGTENKSHLGANAILAVSMAYAVASADSAKIPLFRYLAGIYGGSPRLPRAMANIMNGGAHANWVTDIQEYMIIPQKDEPFHEQLRKTVEVFDYLGEILKKKGMSVNVGNEGGYAPEVKSNEEAFELILQAIQAAGYSAGKAGDFMLGIDVAASEFYQNGVYNLRRDGVKKNTQEMIAWLEELVGQYPLRSIEDGLAESDWKGWQEFTAKHGDELMIVGDDLLVTNVEFIAKAIEQKSCNAVLVKLNQIGTVTETLAAMKLTQKNGWEVIPSHRSGETEDVFLPHLSVGTGAGWIKTGAPSRTDRTAKYNELLRIEEQLNGGSV